MMRIPIKKLNKLHSNITPQNLQMPRKTQEANRNQVIIINKMEQEPHISTNKTILTSIPKLPAKLSQILSSFHKQNIQQTHNPSPFHKKYHINNRNSLSCWHKAIHNHSNNKELINNHRIIKESKHNQEIVSNYKHLRIPKPIKLKQCNKVEKYNNLLLMSPNSNIQDKLKKDIRCKHKPHMLIIMIHNKQKNLKKNLRKYSMFKTRLTLYLSKMNKLLMNKINKMKPFLNPTFKLNISKHCIILLSNKSLKNIKYNIKKKFIMSKLARITKTSMFNILLMYLNLKKFNK